jgi:hypothetical protein
MASTMKLAADEVRLRLIAYGLRNKYRILSLEEIAKSIPNFGRPEVMAGLERLAREGLLTSFVHRYCFNKPVPDDLRITVRAFTTTSGRFDLRNARLV